MGITDYIGWPAARNGIGDGMYLTGDGPKPAKEQWIQDALAGTTVAMILVPEAVAFAFMAGLKPLVGLQAAWIMCLIAGLLGDRPAMISGATGAVAVVLPVITQVNLCQDYLVQREIAADGYAGMQPSCESPSFATPRRLGVMFYAIMLGGVLQFVFGLFKLGKFALLLPQSCMVGFVNGLGVIIFFAQFGHFKRAEIGLSHPLYCQTAFDKDPTGVGKLPEENTDGSLKFPGVVAAVDAASTATEVSIADWCSSAAGALGQQTADGGAFTWTPAVAGRRQLSGSHSVLSDGEPWHDGETLLYMLISIVAVIVMIHLSPVLLKRVPPFYNPQLIPSSLVGIGFSILLEHVIFRNIDKDCDIVPAAYDYDYSASEQRALWIGCGTKTVSEVAMVAGKFPVPIWMDSDSYESFPGSGVKIELKDALPPIDGDLFSEIITTSIFFAVIGLIESLMTQILLNQMLGTPGDASRECVGQGVANFVAGAFGSMGGCVTIGQAMINVGSGAKLRFSSVWAAFILLIIILVAYPIIDLVPVSGLVGVMFDMIAFHIFDWGSLKTMLTALVPEKTRVGTSLATLKVTRTDTVTVIVVAVVSIFTNLAVGVGTGVVLCSLGFAWTHGKEVRLTDAAGAEVNDENAVGGVSVAFKELADDEQKAVVELGMVEETWDSESPWDAGEFPTDEAKAAAATELGYTAANWADLAPKKIMKKELHVEGTLFFGAARHFELLFTRKVIKSCPKYTNLNFLQGEVTDFSAVSGLNNIAGMYDEEGRELHLYGLSAQSHKTMNKSSGLMEAVKSFNKEELQLGEGVAGVEGMAALLASNYESETLEAAKENNP